MLNPGINAMSKIVALHVSDAWSCSTGACSCCPSVGVLEAFWHQHQYARAPWALQAMLRWNPAACCLSGPLTFQSTGINRVNRTSVDALSME